MRKLKLQSQMSVNGYIAGPNGELDWLTWDRDEKINNYVNEINLEPVDCILLGRKMMPGFIDAWKSRVADPKTSDALARKMVDTPKVVFSKTLQRSEWENTTIANGDLVEEVNRLKKQPGKDIIVYGGANFVSNLIKHGLIDEYHLFFNPTAIGKGLTIFNGLEKKLDFKLVSATPYEYGIVVLVYRPK